jgi:hypothetical protein
MYDYFFSTTNSQIGLAQTCKYVLRFSCIEKSQCILNLAISVVTDLQVTYRLLPGITYQMTVHFTITALRISRHAMYISRNIEARLRNHCCRGKAIRITHLSACVCERACVWVLGRFGVCMRVPTCSLAYLA